MPRNPFPLIPAALAVAMLAALAGAALAGPAHGVSCTQGSMHPLMVKVFALDPVARGATVRLLVRASSAVELDQVQARMTSSGGAANLGLPALSLGTLSPGRNGEATFTVAVPPGGGRQYVQFVVSGRGPRGTLSRGACYNLLPDGPAETGRLVVTPQGERVTEVRAGRID